MNQMLAFHTPIIFLTFVTQLFFFINVIVIEIDGSKKCNHKWNIDQHTETIYSNHAT